MTRRSNQLLPIAMLILLLVLPAVFAQEAEWDIEQRIASSGDDSEEFLSSSIDDPQRWPAGFSYAESSDLELGRDATHAQQIVGLRFPELQIPAGAQVTSAVIEFTADTDQSGPLAITIRAQDAADGEPFVQDQDGQGSFDLSSRTTSGATQTWSPEPWAEGEVYRSPDISGVVQQAIESEGWAAGGSLILLLTPTANSGDGLRSAHAYDSSPQLAPRLLVAFGGGEEIGAAPEGEGAAPIEPETVQAEPVEAEPVEAEPAEGPLEAPLDEPGPVEEEPVEAPRDEPEPAESEPVEAQPAERPIEAPQVEPEPAESEPADAAEPPAPEPDEPAQEIPSEVEVEPVDPDPIIPPPKAEPGPSVWPGPDAEQSEGSPDMAKAAEDLPDQSAAAGVDEIAPSDGEPRRARFALRADAARGLKGSVLLSDYGGGVTVVTLFLDNPDSGVTYSASIRQGDCGGAGSRLVDLEPVPGDRAFSTSLLSLDYDDLIAGTYNIAIFRTSGGFTRIASCAQLAAR